MQELTDQFKNKLDLCNTIETSDNKNYISYKSDVWNNWSSKSDNISFESSVKYIGNGEEKLKYELDIKKKLGGQNSTIDLIHEKLGNISVKDMTNDDCTLGVDGTKNIRIIFRKILFPLISWCEKYKNINKSANFIFNELQTTNGKARTNILDGIERFELCNSNFIKLNEILKELKNIKESPATESEYYLDIQKNIQNMDLIEQCNDSVRKEAINYTLIIVHKQKGWMIVKKLENITCPRITRGSPRININYN